MKQQSRRPRKEGKKGSERNGTERDRAPPHPAAFHIRTRQVQVVDPRGVSEEQNPPSFFVHSTVPTTTTATTMIRGGSGAPAAANIVLLLAVAVLCSLLSFRQTGMILGHDLASTKCIEALLAAAAAGNGGSAAAGASGGGGTGAASLRGPLTATTTATSSSDGARSSHSNPNNNPNHHTNHKDDGVGLEPFVAKASGAGWEVWDRRSVLHPELGRESPCDWAEYHAIGRPAGLPPVFACVYPEGQDTWVSGLIRKEGQWVNCNTLTEKLLLAGRDDNNNNKGAGLVFMDIGANIGACVLQILATTEAKVIAFEPSPRNLFRITSSLLNLPQHMKDRVTLFPVALGSEPATASLLANPTNAGNTQVVPEADATDRDENAAVSGATIATRNIPVERMDDLLSKDVTVDLIKMDVQGFECFVLAGMGNVLANTRAIFFEVEEEMLGRFPGGGGGGGGAAASETSCSGARLVRQIQRAGFRVSGGNGGSVQDLSSSSDANLTGVKFDDQDMYGERPRPNA
jgi:FkbM family methyltransferase